jgi:hypothetical protein
MKKNLIVLTLALLIALPVFGLATDTTTPVAPEVQATETTSTAPLGGQYGSRWRQTAPDTTAPQTGFVDADNDGECDNCGNALGTNPEAPNFIDENKDGVCDHFGTDEQGQGLIQGMFGRMQNVQGRGQGMMGQGVQGNAQGSNYLDANNDGVCDNYNSNTQRNFGCGRNRR